MKTMKLFFVAIVSTLVLPACAERDRIITISELPATAQAFLKNFSDKQVSFATIEREGLGKEYDVVFTDGSTVEFNSDGLWHDINCRNSAVPANAVPAQIKDYVKKNYSNVQIRQIEQFRNGYEIDLSNGLELKFDKKFRIKDIDN